MPGHRSSTLVSETREWPVGKGKNREKARILALAHQVQRPALNEQIDQQPLDRHKVAIARLGRRPGADDHRALADGEFAGCWRVEGAGAFVV